MNARMGNNLGQTQLLKTKFKRSATGFRGEPLFPKGPCQTPANFHGRREVSREIDKQQSDRADKSPGTA